LGFAGNVTKFSYDELIPTLNSFLDKVRLGIQRAVEMNAGLPPTYFSYMVEDYEFIRGSDGQAQHDEQDRPYVRVKAFRPVVLPMFLEGPVHALRTARDVESARELYAKIKDTSLYDHKLGMYKVNTALQDLSHEIGRARAFPPGWLENESIFLHMEYKYLLEVLRTGLYDEFFVDFHRAGIPFQNPDGYGRSLLENSSFLVSSAHLDESLHGAGFVARLSGATAEFLSMWNLMMAGKRPFYMKDGELCLEFRPILPSWLFDQDGKITFTFLGRTRVTYYNPEMIDTWRISKMGNRIVTLIRPNKEKIKINQNIIISPYAEMVRTGQIDSIEVVLS
jgi:hypothetical protein